MSESTDELIEDEDAEESATPAEDPPSAVEVDEQTPDGGHTAARAAAPSKGKAAAGSQRSPRSTGRKSRPPAR